MNNAFEEGAAPFKFDALVVGLGTDDLRYSCCYCTPEVVGGDVGTLEGSADELERRLRQHLELRHEITNADIRFYDAAEAAAVARGESTS